MEENKYIRFINDHEIKTQTFNVYYLILRILIMSTFVIVIIKFTEWKRSMELLDVFLYAIFSVCIYYLFFSDFYINRNKHIYKSDQYFLLNKQKIMNTDIYEISIVSGPGVNGSISSYRVCLTVHSKLFIKKNIKLMACKNREIANKNGAIFADFFNVQLVDTTIINPFK